MISTEWPYTTIATVWPFVSQDDFDNSVIYGTPYTIACEFKTDSKLMVNSDGREFTTKGFFYTETTTINRKDFIAKGSHLTVISPIDLAIAEEVQAVKEHDMEFFDETNDFFVVI